MTKTVRRALLGVVAGLALLTGSGYAAAPHAALSAPSGKTVLKQMIAASVKVHTLHAGGNVKGPAGTLNISGDCAGVVRRTKKTVHIAGVKVMSWVHGFLLHASKSSPIDVHLISIQLGLGTQQAWSRSASTKNRWRVAGRDAGIAEIYSSDLCFPLYVQANLSRSKAAWHNLGSQSVNGHSAWHLQSRETKKEIGTTVTNLYVDASTHSLLRYDVVVSPLHVKTSTRTTINFSAFNRKLNIVPPKVGATRP